MLTRLGSVEQQSVHARLGSMVYALFLAVLMMALQLVGAAGAGINFDTVLVAIPNTICNAGNFLRGPVGFAIVGLVFIIGIVRFLGGNRGGLGLVITSMIGGLVLVAAPQILAIFTQDGCIA